jgi:hypothetical protein
LFSLFSFLRQFQSLESIGPRFPTLELHDGHGLAVSNSFIASARL